MSLHERSPMGGQSSGYQSQPMNQWVAGNASAVVDSAVVLVVMATVATCRSRSTSRATANSKATNLRALAGTTTSPMVLVAGISLADGRSSTAIPERMATSVPTATKPTAAVLSAPYQNQDMVPAAYELESRHGSNARAKGWFSPASQFLSTTWFQRARRDGSPTADQLRPIPKAAESVRVPERRQFTVFRRWRKCRAVNRLALRRLPQVFRSGQSRINRLSGSKVTTQSAT